MAKGLCPNIFGLHALSPEIIEGNWDRILFAFSVDLRGEFLLALGESAPMVCHDRYFRLQGIFFLPFSLSRIYFAPFQSSGREFDLHNNPPLCCHKNQEIFSRSLRPFYPFVLGPYQHWLLERNNSAHYQTLLLGKDYSRYLQS